MSVEATSELQASDERTAHPPLSSSVLLCPVAALYVRSDSIYKEMGLDCWDAERDARNWPGGMPCVAHPPCRKWGALKHRATKAPGWEHHLARLAVWQIRDNGGVLEHPLASVLWKDQGLPEPGERDRWGGWSMTIPQRWFGHPMEKLTKLYVCGCEPSDAPEVPYTMESATHAMGGKYIPGVNGQRRRLGRDGVLRLDASSQKIREGTPPSFAQWLVELARRCAKGHNAPHEPRGD
jgi:hypothetical protein